MIEWLALILLIPLILVPIVLLFGFAGCDKVFLDVRPRPFEMTFETTLPLGEKLQRANLCLVQRIEESELNEDGSEVRITLRRPTSGTLLLNNLFISQAADPAPPPHTEPGVHRYDSAGQPTPVLSEPLQLAPDPVTPLVELPEIEYTLDSQQPLLVSFDIGADGTVPCSKPDVPPERARAFVGPLPTPPSVSPIHEAGIADRQPGYDGQPRIYLVERIDTRYP